MCPLPACPGREQSCPELEKYLERNEEEARLSQTCVRELIARLGGTTSDEVLAAGAVLAMLTWEQIQSVAASPEVLHIEPRYGTTPPPSSAP